MELQVTEAPAKPVTEVVTKAVNLTESLFNLSPNKDYTGWPFLNKNATDVILKTVQQAIETKARVAFVHGDIENLKKINDVYGHDKTDQIIANTLKSKAEIVAQIPCAGYFLFRPQAGGDEFQILLIDPSIPPEQIQEKLNKPFTFSRNSHTDTINSDCIVELQSCTGHENAAQVFFGLKEAADKKIEDIKLDKTMKYLRETIQKGREITIEDYIELIAKFWGSRRPREETLYVLFNHIVARAQKMILQK